MRRPLNTAEIDYLRQEIEIGAVESGLPLLPCDFKMFSPIHRLAVLGQWNKLCGMARDAGWTDGQLLEEVSKNLSSFRSTRELIPIVFELSNQPDS